MPKTSPRFARATARHAAEVAKRLRESDRAELAALGHQDAHARLTWAVGVPGDVRAVLNAQGEAVALMGCAEAASGVGSPWMLCADNIATAARLIFKHCPRWAKAWRRRWPKQRNAAHEHNALHHRFIKHCGYAFTGETLVVNGAKFLVFENV